MMDSVFTSQEFCLNLSFSVDTRIIERQIPIIKTYGTRLSDGLQLKFGDILME